MSKTKKSQKTPKKSLMSKAAGLGVSRSTLYAWREQGAPIDKGEAAILEWALAENKKPQDSEELRAAKIAVLRQTERRLKIANDTKAKEILLRPDVERAMGQIFSVLWQTMDAAFQNELPPSLVALDAHQIAARLNIQLEKFREILRVEWKRVCGAEITAADYQAAQLSIEAQAALRVCEARTWKENIHHEWTSFQSWKLNDDRRRAEHRREWCQKQAAAGMTVPNATSEELAQHPGLKRTE
jgi:hypothetical protein